MSHDEIRRPRRIIALAAPPHPVVRSAAPPARRVERFQRALSPPPTALPSTEPRRKLNDAAPALLAETGLARQDLPDTDATDTARDIPAQPSTVAAAAPPADLPPRPESHSEAAPIVAPAGAPVEAPSWAAALADLVAETCERADAAFDHWSVVVPLDAAVLPETALRLDLSPRRLRLRFCTQSTHSLDLLSSHSAALVSMLAQALPHNRDIEIDLT